MTQHHTPTVRGASMYSVLCPKRRTSLEGVLEQHLGRMVLINSKKKYACEPCMKGHRSSSCKHKNRPLFEIKKGRPVTQCEHCRKLRKTKRRHVKCTCKAKESGNSSVGIPAQATLLRGFPDPDTSSPSNADHGRMNVTTGTSSGDAGNSADLDFDVKPSSESKPDTISGTLPSLLLTDAAPCAGLSHRSPWDPQSFASAATGVSHVSGTAPDGVSDIALRSAAASHSRNTSQKGFASASSNFSLPQQFVGGIAAKEAEWCLPPSFTIAEALSPYVQHANSKDGFPPAAWRARTGTEGVNAPSPPSESTYVPPRTRDSSPPPQVWADEGPGLLGGPRACGCRGGSSCEGCVLQSNPASPSFTDLDSWVNSSLDPNSNLGRVWGKECTGLCGDACLDCARIPQPEFSAGVELGEEDFPEYASVSAKSGAKLLEYDPEPDPELHEGYNDEYARVLGLDLEGCDGNGLDLAYDQSHEAIDEWIREVSPMPMSLLEFGAAPAARGDEA